MAGPIERGRPFPRRDDGRRYAALVCPMCLLDRREEVLSVTLLVAHGPNAHEQREKIDAPSYDYACPACGFRFNYPRRLVE